MRNLGLSILGALLLTVGAATIAQAGRFGACNVCTCESGDIVCLDGFFEVLEEQVLCGEACAMIGSTHGSREFIEQPCDTLAQCNHVAAPVANGPWLAVSALALLGLGALGLRRMKAGTTA